MHATDDSYIDLESYNKKKCKICKQCKDCVLYSDFIRDLANIVIPILLVFGFLSLVIFLFSKFS